MPNMTSPAPDTSVLDPKPKSEINGHASPVESKPAAAPEAQVESKSEPAPEVASKLETESVPKPETPTTEATDAPKVNGTSSPKEHATTNGDSSHTPSTKAKEPSAEPATEPATEPAASDSKSSEKSEESTKAPQEPAVARSEDVKMEDASEPVRDEAADKTVEKPVENSTEKPDEKIKSPAKEEPVDTEMGESASEEPAAVKSTDVEESPSVSQDAAGLPTSEVDLHPASLSQLNIENEAGTSPVEPSVEVSMSDAIDGPSAKIAREREDDGDGDEPAAKRAKTEPKEDDASAPKTQVAPADESTIEAAGAAQTSAAVSSQSLDKLPRWTDAENNGKDITPYQRREMRKVIGRVKKTKGGGAFRDSVQKLWPGVWDAYVAKIEKPMDLSEIDRNLRDVGSPTAYIKFDHFRKDLGLIYENTLAFNGATHDVTASALHVIRSTWEEMVSIPFEEPARPKAAPKAKPLRESRAITNAEAAVHRQSAGPTTSPAAEAPEAKRSVPPTDQANRRASALADADRPKRTVRAPKPKDIDYTTKPSRKKLKPELQFCEEILTDLMHPKHVLLNQWFLEPVDAEGLNIPTYYSVIKKPMDLGKVSRLLAGGDITSLKEFDKTVKLIFQNCYAFNGPPEQANPVSLTAKQLEGLYNSLMKGKDAWLSKYAKANAPAASGSNASDDEDDEDDDDGEDAAVVVDNSKEVSELRAKLDEESKKLNGMFASGSNMSIIEIQQGIVKMVQEALLKAVQQSQEVQPKQSKPKKAGKSSKAKAPGGASRKSAGGAVQPKKAGGTKKAAKKHLSAADKDAIANAINDLDGIHLDRAIDIIKRDTGQNENNDGELELDIDQLSQEALLKLWELCKKVLPGFGKDSAGPKTSSEGNRGASAKQAAKSAAKPKKNKPMSAQEQEARIAQLRDLSNLYKPGQEPGEDGSLAPGFSPPGGDEDSSDESDDSEED